MGKCLTRVEVSVFWLIHSCSEHSEGPLLSPFFCVSQARCLIGCVNIHVKVPDGRHARKGRNAITGYLPRSTKGQARSPVPRNREGSKGGYPTFWWERREKHLGVSSTHQRKTATSPWGSPPVDSGLEGRVRLDLQR